MDLRVIKFEIEKWLSINSNTILLKKLSSRIAFFLVTAAYFLSGGLSQFLFWTGILTAIFHTYLNWKYK